MRSKFNNVSSQWTNAVFGKDRLIIRALVVADGILTFQPALKEFSLSLFCDVLRNSASPWETIEVTTAHRSDDNTGANLPGFKFDAKENGAPVFSINRFDQLWLFGQECEASKFILTSTEIEIIRAFMNCGGGVFATGDHQDLGFALCGNLPRVRSMRRWRFFNVPCNEVPAPDRNGPTRIDTLREGIDPGFQGDPEEEDNVPQEIRPKFFVNCMQNAAEPHQLLANGKRAITILPDHMHEGECVSPKEIIEQAAAGNQQVMGDFPLAKDGTPVWPEVVAISTSAGGAFFVNVGIRPVEPRCYIVILAYDGHLVEPTDPVDATTRLGRSVVDASFHHFLNVNLSGFLDAEGKPNNDFDMFAQYYRNIMSYLLPPCKQFTYFLGLLRGLRYSPPLLEEIQNLSIENWGDLIYAGQVTQNAISDHLSSAHARSCALAMVSRLQINVRKPLENLINIWRTRDLPGDNSFLLNSEAVPIVVLGSVMLGLASELPGTYHRVSDAVAELERQGSSLPDLADKGLHHGLTQLQQRISLLAQHLEKLSQLS